MAQEEGVQSTHHIGIGLPSEAAADNFRDALVARGALVVSEDIAKHKYFLRLNPDDAVLFEIFFDDEGPSIHVDFNVADLTVVERVHGMALYDYGIPKMRFLDVPGVPGTEIYPLSLQLAFAERK